MTFWSRTIVIFIMNLLFFSLLFSFQAEFIENKGILFTWEIDKKIREIQILYSPKGKNYYTVAVKRYSFPKKDIKDTFLWVFKPVKYKIFNEAIKNGKIKVVYLRENNTKKEEIINLRDLKNINAGFTLVKENDEAEKRQFSFTPSFDYGTYPNWPMFQVDPQHTGQYPYAVYPPLNYQWTYTLDYNDFMMNSASISSNGVIYLYDGGRFMRAIDIKTGRILWEKGLTANVWTTALVNDTLVLAGTSISFDTTMPTLFLLDARTGDTVWGRHFPGLFTVEFQPIVVDTLIYATTLTKNKIFCVTLDGKKIWSVITDSTDKPPYGGGGYENQKIFIGGDSKIYSIDYYQGNIIWTAQFDSWISNMFPLVNENMVLVFVDSILYNLKQISGEVQWKKNKFLVGNHPTPSFYNDIIFTENRGELWILNKNRGEKLYSTGMIDSFFSQIIILTKNQLLAFSGQYIHLFDLNGIQLFYTPFPGPYEAWRTSWFWPLIYGPYVIITHKKNMYVYKGAEFNPPQNQNYFIFYPVLIKDQGYLFLNLKERSKLKVEIFDIIGKKRKIFNFGVLNKGSHFFVLNLERLSKGVYILRVNNKKQKFLKGG